jgi:hypothetical protein
MIYKILLMIVFLNLGLWAEIVGIGIDVKDKEAIEKEVANISAKVTQLWSYWDVYKNHRDKIRHGFLSDQINVMKGLAQKYLDEAFEKIDEVGDQFEAFKDSIFVIDPKGAEKWISELDKELGLDKIYPEIKHLDQNTLQGEWETGLERVLKDRKTFLMGQLERVQKIAKDLKTLKKVNEERIGRYQEMLKQLKDHIKARETSDGDWNRPMSKAKLFMVTVEIKKEIVNLKRQMFNILKVMTDEELRQEIMYMEEMQYVF